MGGVGEGGERLQRLEVDVVGRVDGLGDAEDGVGDGYAAAEERRIFDVVDAGTGQLKSENGELETYSKLAVWSMPTTFVMTAKLSSGTLSHWLKDPMS